ncbi:MAG: UTP--glucose-1-phosphate uridylyltransferase [Spirochaetales bacterium]|nr:UTP--glucose-1-phosphate uridylyltransferase [Spirochaetales bacterium]
MEKIAQDMKSKHVDISLTLSILERLNRGDYSSEPATVGALPGPDDPAIVDCGGPLSFTVKKSFAVGAFQRFGSPVDPTNFGSLSGNDLIFDEAGLEKLGSALAPLLSYGVLNGGSATSYADITRNRSFDPGLFEYYADVFDSFSDSLRGMPKGLTPAYVQPGLTPGPTFMELKMRGLLAGGVRAKSATDAGCGLEPYLPAYQMTSMSNDDAIRQAYAGYRNSPLLAELNAASAWDVTQLETAIQPLITAFERTGGRWSIFSKAHGRENSVLPLPGGHGQCFVTLKRVFERLRNMGKRFVLLGNVDNLGNMPKPAYLALLALSGAPAGFEFAYRTPVDVKGGILVRDKSGRLTCADIGPAIRQEDVLEAEKGGAKILFNCATGLFSLDYLVENIDRIVDSIPLRVSKQQKDAGLYYQAEQITWEVISLMDNPLIFGVRKHERFLAAKLFIENLLTSGIGLDDPGFPAGPEMKKTAVMLNNGLTNLLSSVYAMDFKAGRWRPRA